MKERNAEFKSEYDLFVYVVAKHYGLQENKLRAKRAGANERQARNMVMYLLRRMYGLSYREIGKYVNLDHLAVRHITDEIGDRYEKSAEVEEIIGEVIEEMEREQRLDIS